MKAQPLAEKLLDELTGFDQNILLTEFKQRRFLSECDKAIRVNPAEGYMCKAIVYALSNDFENMRSNFQNAIRLSPADRVIKGNFVATLGNYGRYEEVKDFFSKEGSAFVIDKKALLRALIADLDIDALKIIQKDFTDKIENLLSKFNLDIEQVKRYILLFNELMRSKGVRFGLVPPLSWQDDEDDIYIYYNFVGTVDESLSIMDEFDRLVAQHSLKLVARKLIIVLLPFIPG